MKKIFLLVALLFSASAFAQFEANMNHFRFAAMGLYHKNQSSYSMIGSWNPKFYRSGNSVFGVNLGASIFEDQLHKKFVFVESTLTYRYLFTNRWKAEAGLGFQSMSQDIGVHGVATLSVHYAIEKNKLNIDEVFLGYSNFSYGKEEIHQVRIGVGFHF